VVDEPLVGGFVALAEDFVWDALEGAEEAVERGVEVLSEGEGAGGGDGAGVKLVVDDG
jgi:hypothetical protein